MIRKLSIIIFLFLVIACQQATESPNIQFKYFNLQQKKEMVNPNISNRDSLIMNLRKKIENKKPIVIHAFVALYGYDSVKIEGLPDWSDGTNQNTNLYWGAGYGIKTYFKKYDNWKLIFTETNISKSILERLVFKKNFPNGAEVYLIADAYVGYEMQTCLKDYFSAIAERNLDSLKIANMCIPANGNANLIVFNGHNGLMDYQVKPEIQKCNRLKESVVIACHSSTYFKDDIRKCYTFPLITTRGLIPAEAYILGAIIEPWISLKSESEIKECLLKKYMKIQKCSKEEADALFMTN